MEIREVDSTESGLVAAIVKAANIPVAEQFGLTRDNAPSHPSLCTPEWIRSGMDRGERYFVCGAAQDTAGCVAYESPEPGLAYLNRLAVLPGFQHRGVGRRLVEHVIYLANKDGKTRVSIGIIKAHKTLKNWYEALGFTVSGTKCFNHLPFDVLFMTYSLELPDSTGAGE